MVKDKTSEMLAIEPKKKVQIFTWALAIFLSFVPLALILLNRIGVIAEGDILWETRAGLDLLDEGTIIRPDAWSWTGEGKDWIPNSWGWNVILAIFWKMGSFAGLGILNLVGIVFLYSILFYVAYRYGSKILPTALVYTLAAVLLTPWLTIRPQLATYILTICIVVLLPQIFVGNKWRFLILIGILQVVAVNLHLGAFSTVLLALGAGGIWWVKECVLTHSKNIWNKDIFKAAVPGTLIALCSTFSPVGLNILNHATGVRGESTVNIVEWAPGYSTPLGVIALSFGLLGVFAAWHKNSALCGAILTAVLLSVVAIRFTPIAIILAMPALSAWLSQTNHLRKLKKLTLPLIIVGVLLSLGLAPSALAALQAPGTPDPAHYSLDAVEKLPADCKTLNTYIQGGPIVLLRPDVQVSMDGRNDFHGAERVEEQLAVISDNADADTYLESNNIECILLEMVNYDAALGDRLKKDPRWEIKFNDSKRLLLVKVD